MSPKLKTGDLEESKDIRSALLTMSVLKSSENNTRVGDHFHLSMIDLVIPFTGPSLPERCLRCCERFDCV